ncbi:MAG TPA: DUF6481 family protein [Phenylobacterium sp.]|jgi:hypothetical protein|nr:DUF6481 family protein [Phenylobacterium sp.]
MKDLKGAGLTDRLSAAAAAKAALVEKLRPKAAVTDPLFAERGAMRQAELKAVRETRASQKQAAILARSDAEAASQAAVTALEEQALTAKRDARKERKQLTKAEGQAKRDARYAARKARR